MDRFFIGLCSVYYAIVLLFSVVTCYEDAVWLFIPAVVLLYWILEQEKLHKAVYKKLNRTTYSSVDTLPSKEKMWGITMLSFICILGFHLIYWFAYYPGIFNLDALGQWDQIHGLQCYSDWHPIMNTLLYWCLTRFSDSMAFCIFVQLLAFCAVIALLLMRLCRLGLKPELAIGASVFIGASPSIALCNIAFTKDVFFTIFVVALYICAIDIYCSKGAILRNPKQILVTALLLTLTTLMRHNGILFSGTFVLILVVFYASQYRGALAGIINIWIAILIVVKCFLFPLLNVRSHENVVGESIGVPMAIMANALVNYEEDCPDEVKDFLFAIAGEEQWKEHYYIGEWDSCKWVFGGTELLNDVTLPEILRLAFCTIKACPQAAYESLRENTRVVWQALGSSYWSPLIYIEENEYGIEPHPVAALQSIANQALDLSFLPVIRDIVWNAGLYIAAILIVTIGIIKQKEYAKILFVFPLITYTFGTMFLLCGASYRYFYVITALSFPLLFCLACMPHEENKN